MPDDDEHYIVFERGATMGYRCSDDAKEVPKFSLSEGLQSVLNQRGKQARDLGEGGLRDISNRMLDVLARGEKRIRSRAKSIDVPGLRKIVDDRPPAESIGYMARTFFDAELLILE
jgi:hypothetical protein